MGQQVAAKCLDCGRRFTVDHGGGFSFHLVRCDRCGKTKGLAFEELGELHLRYLKGLPGPYAIASAAHDEHVRLHAPVQPISEKEYHKGIEALAVCPTTPACLWPNTKRTASRGRRDCSVGSDTAMLRS